MYFNLENERNIDYNWKAFGRYSIPGYENETLRVTMNQCSCREFPSRRML